MEYHLCVYVSANNPDVERRFNRFDYGCIFYLYHHPVHKLSHDGMSRCAAVQKYNVGSRSKGSKHYYLAWSIGIAPDVQNCNHWATNSLKSPWGCFKSNIGKIKYWKYDILFGPGRSFYPSWESYLYQQASHRGRR